MTVPHGQDKPKKPYPNFPCYAHPSGQWAFKCKGKTYYAGPWSDPDAAVRCFNEWRPLILQGIDPRRMEPVVRPGTLTVKQLCNQFLQNREQAVRDGEMTDRMFASYVAEAKRICDVLGRDTLVEKLASADFVRLRESYPASWGQTTRGDHIVKTRTIFTFALKDGLIDRPVVFGVGFEKPKKQVYARRQSQEFLERGTLDLTADECRRLVANSGEWLKAAILLGLNAGLGNTDVAQMTRGLIQPDGWVVYPRGKTGVVREFWLWPETQDAIRIAQEARGEPCNADDGELLFLTGKGRPLVWGRADGGRWIQTNNLTTAFGKLMRKLGIKRQDVGFYSLRRTFATVGSGSKDQVAVDYIMGHSGSTMSDLYRQRVDRCRLRDVAEFVRKWLFGDGVPVHGS